MTKNPEPIAIKTDTPDVREMTAHLIALTSRARIPEALATVAIWKQSHEQLMALSHRGAPQLFGTSTDLTADEIDLAKSLGNSVEDLKAFKAKKAAQQ